MWLSLLSRFWRPLAGALVVLALLWAVYHRGYAAGIRDERAVWTPQLIAAEKARAEADARTAAVEAAQTAATSNAEARHAETVQALNTRAADADRRIRALSVRLASANSSRCEVRPVPNSAAESHDSATSVERAERAGSELASLARRCELDSAALAGLQSWIREQSALSR